MNRYASRQRTRIVEIYFRIVQLFQQTTADILRPEWFQLCIGRFPYFWNQERWMQSVLADLEPGDLKTSIEQRRVSISDGKCR